MKIKKDDTVMVLTGKDKGKTGKVLKAMPKEGRVIVEGVNVQTKHQKQTCDKRVAAPFFMKNSVGMSGIPLIHFFR